MTFQLGLADALRAEGLTVVEVNGWRTRGYAAGGDPSGGLDPRGSVNHHTGNPNAGALPSLATLINGRADLPGPLCNDALSRATDSNGLYVAYVIAAGRANHAGSGGWKGLAGNSSVLGCEVEHAGTTAELLPAARRDSMVRVHAAHCRLAGITAAMVCQHWEWTDRKIDFLRAELNADWFRMAVAARLAAPPAAHPIYDYPEAQVRSTLVSVRLDGNGNGYNLWDPGFDRPPIGPHATVNAAWPPTAGYQPIPMVGAQVRDNSVAVIVEGGKPGATIDVHVSAA